MSLNASDLPYLREFYSPVIGLLQTHEGFHELSGGQRITFHYNSDLKSGPVVLDRAQAPARERVGPPVRDLAPSPEE
jgi:hypothetical protein